MEVLFLSIDITFNMFNNKIYIIIKALIKPFEAPQRSVKINISVIFFSSSGIGTEKLI